LERQSYKQRPVVLTATFRKYWWPREAPFSFLKKKALGFARKAPLFGGAENVKHFRAQKETKDALDFKSLLAHHS